MTKKYLISKNLIKKVTGLRISKNAVNYINEKVLNMLKEMRSRTLANGRQTIYPRDV